MQGLEGWETRSGTDGTLAVKEVKGYAKVIHPRKGQAVLDHVLWMKRTAKGPNMAAQVIKGLETGKLYSLRMLSGDYKELMAGKSTATNHALGVNLENVEILPNESFVGIVKASHWVDAYGFGENNPYCLNYYCKVFRAKGKTARLVISDWMDERNVGGPEGQELICNFIQIQPFFSQGNMAPKSE